MIYPMVLFPVTIFRGHGVTISLDSLDILSAQLKRDLFSIGKFLSLSARAGSLVYETKFHRQFTGEHLSQDARALNETGWIKTTNK